MSHAVDSGKSINTDTLSIYTVARDRVYNYDRNAEFAANVMKAAMVVDLTKCDKTAIAIEANIDAPQFNDKPLTVI